MAITNSYYTGLTTAVQDPFGGFVASNTSHVTTQYGIHNLPPRLRGMDIDRTLKTVNYVISDALYAQSGNDPSFRNMVKMDLSRLIAEEVFKVTKFTQIKDPYTFDTKVIGRVVIMTEDQLNKLIQAAR